jgi:hypothetical protein
MARYDLLADCRQSAVIQSPKIGHGFEQGFGVIVNLDWHSSPLKLSALIIPP